MAAVPGDPEGHHRQVMSELRPVRLLVRGTGEQGDGAAAFMAVSSLLQDLPGTLAALLDIRWCEQLEIEDLLDVPPSVGCVIVDTLVGMPLGSMATIPLCDLPDHAGVIDTRPTPSCLMPIGQLMAIAEILRDEPLDGALVGIGGGPTGLADARDTQVRRALPAFQVAIEAALRAAASRSSTGGP